MVLSYFSLVFPTVKFVIMPDGHVVSMNCSLRQTFSEVRTHFSTELEQPAEMILLLFDGKPWGIICIIYAILIWVHFT